MDSKHEHIIPLSKLHEFVVNILLKSGASEEHAHIASDSLVTADYRGHYSHGVGSIGSYIEDLTLGKICGGGKAPCIVKETVATALVNGNDLMGFVVGKFCMELAMEKAKAVGIGMVSNRGSNHFGFAGWYSMMASKKNLLGFAFTNSSPVVAYTGTNTCAMGSNPISFTAPGTGGDNFELDMATCVVAHGKTVVKSVNGQEMPSGWAIDKQGKETKDPNDLHAMLPLGGFEDTSGYKGSGLALMVEILCSVLGGSSPSPLTRVWGTYDKPADVAHCFIAIDPSVFAEGFSDRLDFLMTYCRNLQTVNGEKNAMVAGDPEKKHMELCDNLGGIPYSNNQMHNLNQIADRACVQQIQCLKAMK